MIKMLFQIVVFSAIGVLAMPGNEAHRDQALRSLVAAYANAATYCNRHPDSCEKLSATINESRLAFLQEPATFNNTLHVSHPDQYRRD